jgi:hypothetical protein
MIFEPGILDLAHGKGIKFLDDVNKDGKIDRTDMNLALKAKSAAAQASKAAAISS